MKIKKYLPLILVVVGLVAIIVAFFVFRNKGSDTEVEETALMEVSLDERPVAKLIPSVDGHWLKLVVEKLVIDEAETMDYELLYKLPDGRTQGVPGNIKLKGIKEVDRDLLLGSESSGKFRYDEGVEDGTLTLRYRNSKGKLLAKFTTEFALVSDTKKLASTDGKFKATLDSTSDDYFVIMETFGIPETFPGNLANGPYGVFNSSEKDLDGNVDLSGAFRWTSSKWTDTFDEATGIFVGSSKQTFF